MTTEKETFEAQEILKEFRKGLDSLSEYKLIGALDMAIEVLNHSEIPNGSGKDTNVPSKDCIDRAEAQTAIQFAARRYTVAHEAHGEGHVVWSDNLISVTDAMNALREVPPAQPESIQNNAVHLCDSCQYTYVTCPSHGNDAVFGDGKGNDNICACNKYRPISAQPERPKGHWIFDFAHNEMTCSECGRTFTGGFDLENADNFCRHCGSDNRGEKDGKTT